ncbi:PREDICTED: uncharacterized protein LOC107070359 [Polistes dominula]|uniref:Uncharacterized protein LOC107070359 n=1 Tax=Polistes dominula TaxID=743375 RepID=A0ABM1IUS1_POLDO|nr:PREDICTED: uncharacterized protein LOC107070359 [Polistes dominula]
MSEHINEKKKKKNKKKKKKKSKTTVAKRTSEIKAKERKACEEEQLHKWEEAWRQKVEAQEELDDYRCCLHKGLCLKPKTQSNIWINVIEDKMTQEVHIAFKHVPVPKPKPPSIPKFKIMEISSSCKDKIDQIHNQTKKETKAIKKKKKKKSLDEENGRYIRNVEARYFRRVDSSAFT